jgi:hypothetical protein
MLLLKDVDFLVQKMQQGIFFKNNLMLVPTIMRVSSGRIRK